MSLLLPCPNCGHRDVNEFVYAGEVTERPAGRPTPRMLNSYVYFRRNVAGVQTEWWFHRFGCEEWFLAERDTRTNAVLRMSAVADTAPRRDARPPSADASPPA